MRNAIYVVECVMKQDNPGLQQQLRRMNDAIARGNKLITELLDFVRADTLRYGSVALDDWL